MKELNVKQAKLWFVTTEENAGNFELQKTAAVGGKEQDDMGSELEVQQSVACIRPNSSPGQASDAHEREGSTRDRD
jgi:hypothetical protein